MHRIGAALLCGAIAVTPALGLADADATLEELVVEMAETPHQHAALARYYRARAEEARTEAIRHDRMGRSYRGRKRIVERVRMRKHCQKISEQYSTMATEYDELAKLHDGEAK